MAHICFFLKEKNFPSSLPLLSMPPPPPPSLSAATVLPHRCPRPYPYPSPPLCPCLQPRSCPRSPSALPRTSATPTLAVPPPFLLTVPTPQAWARPGGTAAAHWAWAWRWSKGGSTAGVGERRRAVWGGHSNEQGSGGTARVG